ncbi:MAG: hypothetical protein FRX48_00438 [Lasallia pustulata]|uniref:Uncharacterized protein n=1 Tax=Lasallia pustulata TaxID=136370 RepID=A0A5M8Q2S6_9LECA|nr:MAG: hypothetical protein FRX48_00438 [Lasallia pustulata]
MAEENQASVPAKAHLAVSLTTSSPTISLSDSPSSPPFHLIVTTCITSSTNPGSAITLCTDGSVLDNGQHERQDGLFWGAFLPLQSTTQPSRCIPIAYPGSPNYGSTPDASPNLRERHWMRFETVPPMGQGALRIEHELSLDRMFQNSRLLKAADVRPGEKFRVQMDPKRLFWAGWWTFGALNDGELGGKRFAKWERPDEDGSIGNLMPGEQRPDFKRMEKEGVIVDFIE